MSQHMPAIPSIGPKPNGLGLLDTVIVDHRVNDPLVAQKVVTAGSLLAPGMVSPEKLRELNEIVQNAARPNFPDFATSCGRLLGVGMGAFGE